MWGAKGFLEPKVSQSIDEFALECFERLLSCNLVVVRKQSLYRTRVKACSLHFVYRIMCRKEARNETFLHTLKRYADGVAERMESQCRLAIYNNTLFSIKDVASDPLLHHRAPSVIASKVCISTVRSLLCTGAYHQYQVPLCSDLRLLRVLDALTIRFYEFPIEVLKLVQLRYLALTCNKNLPPYLENWEAGEDQFLKLKYLSIEDTDLVQWTVGDETFPFLWFLSMKNCYKLRVMRHISYLRKVVLEDCNTSAMASAEQIITSRRSISAYSSWNDGKLKK